MCPHCTCTSQYVSVRAQDPQVFWEAATLVDAFNVRKGPEAAIRKVVASLSEFYLLSREPPLFPH